MRRGTYAYSRGIILSVYKHNFEIFFQILHALGLLHEHQRPDRDQYINIDMTAAAKTGLLQDFQKASFLERANLNYNIYRKSRNFK